ncbi:MAG: (2Fe-2S)-binding protein [Burkholderiales bacterium]|nr:(2Fe-2S)-binding protein [Burkholderiales bacterium]
MFVCVCQAVSDREIRQCADLGVASLDDLRASLGVAACCGRCAATAEQILAECALACGRSQPAARA